MTTTWYRSFFFNICYSSNNSIKLLTAFERQRFNTFDTHLGHLDILLGIELLFSAFEPLSSFKLFMSETVMCRSLLVRRPCCVHNILKDSLQRLYILFGAKYIYVYMFANPSWDIQLQVIYTFYKIGQ